MYAGCKLVTRLKGVSCQKKLLELINVGKVYVNIKIIIIQTELHWKFCFLHVKTNMIFINLISNFPFLTVEFVLWKFYMSFMIVY